MRPATYPAQFYDFQNYNSKHRLLTYWYQIKEILALQIHSLLEVGVGSGLVTAYLRSQSIYVETMDINPSLAPDHTGSLLEISEIMEPAKFDVVLCARVLHHLEFEHFEAALKQLAYATKEYVLLTLPYEDARLYFMFRYTSSRIRTYSVPIPLTLKRILLRKAVSPDRLRTSSFWKIADSKDRSLENAQSIISRHFEIMHSYRIPEDSAHYLAVLRKR